MRMRRRGRGLIGVAATTAVVAGTAGAVRHHQQQKYAAQDQAQYDQQMAAQQAAQQQAYASPATTRRCGTGSRTRLHGRTGEVGAVEGAGDYHRRGVPGQEETDSGDIAQPLNASITGVLANGVRAKQHFRARGADPHRVRLQGPALQALACQRSREREVL